MRKCPVCSEPVGRNKLAVYCGTRCRVRAFRARELVVAARGFGVSAGAAKLIGRQYLGRYGGAAGKLMIPRR